MIGARRSVSRVVTSAASTLFHSEPVPKAYAQLTLGNLDLEEGHYEEANARFLGAQEVALPRRSPQP